MSEENFKEDMDIDNNNINNQNDGENNSQKKSNKRRRKELIDSDIIDDNENINNNNEFKIIQNEELIKEENITNTNTKEIVINNHDEKKYKTIEHSKTNKSPFKDNSVLQEKLKKIFLNRDKNKFHYTKQELPENLKYHSDDSDSSESPGLRKSKLLKKENSDNKQKENNLIIEISDKKNIDNNKEPKEDKEDNNTQKKNLNEEKYKVIDIKEDEENLIMSDVIDQSNNNNKEVKQLSNVVDNSNKNQIFQLSINLNNSNQNSNSLSNSNSSEVPIFSNVITIFDNNNEKILESNQDKINITSNLVSKNENNQIIDKKNNSEEKEKTEILNKDKEFKEIEDKGEIKDINNNEDTLKIKYNEKAEIKRNQLINQIKKDSIKYENKENEINNNYKNRLTIKTNQNESNSNENLIKKEKIKNLFNIVEKLKENKSKKNKLEIIKFPDEQRNSIKKKNSIDKNNNNNIFTPKAIRNNLEEEELNKDKIKPQKKYNENLNIFLNNKESYKNNFSKKEVNPKKNFSPKINYDEINNIYSTKSIPHSKQNEKFDKKILNNINIPRKTSGANRYLNTPSENTREIDITTTPSSTHLDKSFDAINIYNKMKISNNKKPLNIYKPKKANMIKATSKGKKEKKFNNDYINNNINKNNFIPSNQNIIYNNFNNFFNSPNFYRNTNKNAFNKKNNSYSEYPIDNYNQNQIKESNDNNVDLYLNQNTNNSFDGYMNLKIDNRNKSIDKNNIYYGNNMNQPSSIPRYKPINNIPMCQINYNRNLALNNFYRNDNNNKSFGNIFTGINNNIFDINNYINTNDFMGNLSTKNNSINKQKFLSYNILNQNPTYNNIPISTTSNNQMLNSPNILYQNPNLNSIPPQHELSYKNINCIYNNKYNNQYQNADIYNNSSDINMNLNINKPKKTKNTSINIEDLLVLEEKLNEINISLKRNGYMHYECFEFWNYYYNCSLFGKLEKLFKTQNDKINVQISIYHILLTIMICYDYSYEINILNDDYSTLEDLLKLDHKILMIIYEHILSKISSESKSNIWVYKLRNLLNNFIKSNDNDYFKTSAQMSAVEKIIYNTSAIVQTIRVLLKNYKTKNYAYLTNLYKKISDQSYEEINTYFRDYILRVDNYNGSVLASVFLKENQNFKTEPAPYIHTKNRKGFSLILDLDETLVHFKINSENESEGVLQIRPGVIPFLEKVGKFYELIVFTAATQDYGDLLIDAIEENNVYFEHRFYRQHTVIIGNDFVKDLNRIGRPLDKMIIVDNMPQNFRLQKENGINIKAFWGEDVNDNALKELGIILVNIAREGGDVRFGLEKYKDEIIRKVTSNIFKSNY